MKVFQEWKDISSVIRSRVFKEEEEQEIVIHDVKVKICFFFLRLLLLSPKLFRAVTKVMIIIYGRRKLTGKGK